MITEHKPHSEHVDELNEFRGFNPKYDAALDGLLEQFEALKMQERANAQAFEDSEREVERLREQFESMREALEMIAADPYPGVPNHAAQIVARNALTAVSSPS